MELILAISALDYLAFFWFVLMCTGYVWYAKRYSREQDSLLTSTNRLRLEWLKQTTMRDPRVIDGIITQTLSTTPSFFCNTTILVIGGLLAVFSTSDKALAVMQDLPFAAKTSQLVLDVKLGALLAVFIYAFFRFSWSMRLYTFVALSIGAMPEYTHYEKNPQEITPAAERTAKLVAAAAEAFNDGLRTYYFAFALVAWLFSALAFMVASTVVVVVLFRREFKSELLDLLR